MCCVDCVEKVSGLEHYCDSVSAELNSLNLMEYQTRGKRDKFKFNVHDRPLPLYRRTVRRVWYARDSRYFVLSLLLSLSFSLSHSLSLSFSLLRVFFAPTLLLLFGHFCTREKCYVFATHSAVGSVRTVLVDPSSTVCMACALINEMTDNK